MSLLSEILYSRDTPGPKYLRNERANLSTLFSCPERKDYCSPSVLNPSGSSFFAVYLLWEDILLYLQNHSFGETGDYEEQSHSIVIYPFSCPFSPYCLSKPWLSCLECQDIATLTFFDLNEVRVKVQPLYREYFFGSKVFILRPCLRHEWSSSREYPEGLWTELRQTAINYFIKGYWNKKPQNADSPFQKLWWSLSLKVPSPIHGNPLNYLHNCRWVPEISDANIMLPFRVCFL